MYDNIPDRIVEEQDAVSLQDVSGEMAVGAIAQFARKESIDVADVQFEDIDQWVVIEESGVGLMGRGKFEWAKESLLESDGLDREDARHAFRYRVNRAFEQKREDEQLTEKGITLDLSRREEIRRRGRRLDKKCSDKLFVAFTQQVWPDGITKDPSWQSDDDVTADTKRWVDAVFSMEDPVYDEYANIPQLKGLEVKEKIIGEMKSDEGWSLASIKEDIENQFGVQMSEDQIRTIARTETAAVLNRSQMAAIEARSDDPVVRWVGPEDGDQTDMCEELARQTVNGVPYSTFKDLAADYASEYPAGKTDRIDQGVLHFQERYTIEVIS